MLDDPQTEVRCHYCGKKYLFTPEELKALPRKHAKLDDAN